MQRKLQDIPNMCTPTQTNRPDSALQRCDLLGFFTHPGTLQDYLDFIANSIDTRCNATVYYHNLHTLYLYVRNDAFRQTFDNKTVIVDGMGVLFLYKLARFALTRDYRLTYVDFIFPLMELARDKGWRVYHVGQQSDVQQRALDIIRQRVPGIEICGHDGYFDQHPSSSDSHQVIADINARQTDLLLVGTSTPLQEHWVNNYRDDIAASVVLTCGSCMEYVAGEVGTAPRWMGRAGLEWLYRLCDNPRRFAFRYLVQPFLLGALLLQNWLEDRAGRGNT